MFDGRIYFLEGYGLDERLKSAEFKGEQFKLKLYSNVDMYKYMYNNEV